MNKIILYGRLVRDPDLKNTKNGNAVCSFTIAVNRDFGEGSDFIDCTAWKKTAELIAKHYHKGSNILLEGSLQSRKFEDKSGNKRTAWEVQVGSLHFVDRGAKKDSAPEQTTFEEVDDVDDGTLPF